MAALRRCSPAAASITVFNTHFHAEHTGANERLREAGATIVAHENTRLWMATPTWLPAEDRYRAAAPQGRASRRRPSTPRGRCRLAASASTTGI